jgi:hypothetical protein
MNSMSFTPPGSLPQNPGAPDLLQLIPDGLCIGSAFDAVEDTTGNERDNQLLHEGFVGLPARLGLHAPHVARILVCLCDSCAHQVVVSYLCIERILHAVSVCHPI